MKQIVALILLACALHAATSLAEDGRVIVKYRGTAATPPLDYSARFSTRLGLVLHSGRHLDARMHVLHAGGLTSEALAARLSRQSEVEYAVPDQRRFIYTLPNDPLLSSQWYLQAATAATPSAIDAVDAWNQTTGSATVVVADIDTGVRFDHPDLANTLLPGADFILDTANGGADDHPSATDPAGSDPGDYVSAADLRDSKLTQECSGGLSQQNSSWHGTRVMGILGAAGNNGVGIAGTAWGVKLLPVRVLGKCGGFDSDIIAGMLWAAGISGTPQKGAASNPNPAKIINLSLGGSGSCTAAYADAISQLTAKGVLVVAAAGNTVGPVGVPGNCAGVLTVAGLRNIGGKVGYSSFGAEVSVSAPAGNCVNSSGPCLYSMGTTTNLGTTVPATNGYTDETNYNIGTSLSSPQVAGVAALMLSLNPALQPADLISRIQHSARVFPVDPTLPTCPNYANSGSTSGQCNCTTATCGAGMLNAVAAVAAAWPPTAAIQTTSPLTAGTTVGLTAASSQAAPGRSISTWQWQLLSAPTGASLTSYNTATTAIQAVTAGIYTVSLTVTDNLGASNTTQSTLTVSPATSTPTPPAASSGGGGGGAMDSDALPGLAGLVTLAYFVRRSKAQSVPAR